MRLLYRVLFLPAPSISAGTYFLQAPQETETKLVVKIQSLRSLAFRDGILGRHSPASIGGATGASQSARVRDEVKLPDSPVQ
ncbi:hypothetical protein DFJ73DRAFT_807153 [Zopfochytrium polystomum]|nr:hypothetical protein DFJ73DRAFT_807153 [Zopfochytrium polystomum]